VSETSVAIEDPLLKSLRDLADELRNLDHAIERSPMDPSLDSLQGIDGTLSKREVDVSGLEAIRPDCKVVGRTNYAERHRAFRSFPEYVRADVEKLHEKLKNETLQSIDMRIAFASALGEKRPAPWTEELERLRKLRDDVERKITDLSRQADELVKTAETLEDRIDRCLRRLQASEEESHQWEDHFTEVPFPSGRDSDEVRPVRKFAGRRCTKCGGFLP